MTRTRGALRKRLLSPRRSSLIQRVKGIHLNDENSFSSERTVEASKQAKTTATRPKAKATMLSHGSSSHRRLPEEDGCRKRKRARKACETSRRRAANVLRTVSFQEHATSASLRSAGRRATRSPTSPSDAGSLRRQPCSEVQPREATLVACVASRATTTLSFASLFPFVFFALFALFIFFVFSFSSLRRVLAFQLISYM